MNTITERDDFNILKNIEVYLTKITNITKVT